MKTLHLGHGFVFNTNNGCLTHPGGHLTSWFRREENRFVPLEWASPLHPDTSRRICKWLADPDFLAGKIHLPLRRE